MKWMFAVIALSFALANVAHADQCHDIAKTINEKSREALNNINKDPELSKSSSESLFAECRKYVALNPKCENWKWLDTSRSTRSFCYEAILTEDRKKAEASKALLDYAGSLRPKAGSSNATSGSSQAR